jgi:hypothetical protein
MPIKNPSELTFDEVVNELGSNRTNGLTNTEAALRLQTYGPNKLEGEPKVLYKIV